MINYEKSIIYKIVCNTTGYTYIGSTTGKLNERLNKHKCDAKNGKGITSSKCLENNDYFITPLEYYPCTTKKDLLDRERFYIENYIKNGNGNCVNKVIPNRTWGEWYRFHRIKLLLKKGEVIYCECGLPTTRSHIRRHQTCKRHHLALGDKN